MFSLLTDVTVDGFALWIVLLLCLGVFLASFMDAIAGGGGIISGPAHLIAFGNLPAPYALGTNKVSAAIGTVFSTARFIKNGYVDWRLFGPAIAFALAGSAIGTWLQHLTPDAVLTDTEGALHALGELTGRTLREDMVARIFERFCVGK